MAVKSSVDFEQKFSGTAAPPATERSGGSSLPERSVVVETSASASRISTYLAKSRALLRFGLHLRGKKRNPVRRQFSDVKFISEV